MDLIRYNKGPMIETAKRNDLMAGDLLKRCYSISASFNPYLKGKLDYWIKYNGKKYYSAKQEKTFLINFEDMYKECIHVLFFTYLKDITQKKGKLLILKYPRPSCFYEMEIRFIFPDRKKIKLIEINEKKCLEIAKKTSFKTIAGEIEKLEKKYDFSELNYLFISREMGWNIEKELREVIEVIKRYDKKIINFIKEFNIN